MKNNLKNICFGIITIGIIGSCAAPKSSSSSIKNMVARMEVKEPINGVCDNANVVVILPFPGNGQVKAIAPKTKEEIIQELILGVSFLKDKADYNDKGMVNLIINCEGELVRCEVGNKTKSPELDSQIQAVFATLKTWTAGKINDKSVDTVVMYSFTIENGKINIS